MELVADEKRLYIILERSFSHALTYMNIILGVED